MIAFVLNFHWFPFVTIQTRFAHELNRFTSRIQSIASKEELAELAVAEAKVYNEQTLREFVETAYNIAAQYRVSELVKTFNLWDSTESKGQSATLSTTDCT